MNTPVLHHDPTSEPSRAVHWLLAEAGFEVDIEYTWLTRGDHLKADFLAVNPGHQVPALTHGAFRLAEASAIMLYLADIYGLQQRWVGASAQERAWTQRFLSWHHTNTRRITLDHFLPVLLMPAYHGVAPPRPEAIEEARTRGRERLELLQGFIATRGPFLGGAKPSIADLLIASDLFALDLDPGRDSWFEGLDVLSSWLERLRETKGYQRSHGPWNAILPRLKAILDGSVDHPANNRWVAAACMTAADSGESR